MSEEESGYMLMKDGKAWGVTHRDGQSTSFGWVKPRDAMLFGDGYLKQPSDVTYPGSPYEDEVKKGRIVLVTKRSEIIVHG